MSGVVGFFKPGCSRSPVQNLIPPRHPKMPVGKCDSVDSEVSSDENTGCLGFLGDYTTQVYRDYNKPL